MALARNTELSPAQPAVSPSTGTIQPGDSQTVTVTISPFGRPQSTYGGTVTFQPEP